MAKTENTQQTPQVGEQPTTAQIQRAKIQHLTKQEYLDIDEPTPEQWSTQQLITGMNKTQLTNAWRSLSQISAAAYKTKAQNLPFHEMVQAVATALSYNNDSVEN